MLDVKKANQACSESFIARSYIWTEYGKIRTRKNSAFGHISCSESFQVLYSKVNINLTKI